MKDNRHIKSAGMSGPVKVGRRLTCIEESVESPNHCLRYSLIYAGDTLSYSGRHGKPSLRAQLQCEVTGRVLFNRSSLGSLESHEDIVDSDVRVHLTEHQPYVCVCSTDSVYDRNRNITQGHASPTMSLSGTQTRRSLERLTKGFPDCAQDRCTGNIKQHTNKLIRDLRSCCREGM